ncbi:GGDEF domain-containing protein [Actinoplanes solisilvae]|uniref:GGDEF domain-containing protein n=1 Tax=Actinoplanes solisilvae TaxID=2486853 RepID=UPI000FDC23ED|nr:GGDEF domain-containing protein [Actinoplanes solisilvae]
MNTILDPSVLRRRRTTEASALLSRGLGMVATTLFLFGLVGAPPEAEDALPVRLSCWTGLVLMTLALGFSTVNLRRPGGPRYNLFGRLQVIFDTLAISGIVVGIQAYSGRTVWPMLAVPVLVSAMRGRVPGALIAWAATSGILIVAAVVFGGEAMPPDDLVLALLVNLFVAGLCGTQSAAYSRQVNELTTIRGQLHHQATHDGLTGLPNRKHLRTHADDLTGRPMALLLLDLNGFKAVNDTLGHAAGDELLRVTASRLRAHLRPADLAGRIGGDEFLVLLADATPAEADALAARLRTEISRPADIDGRAVTVGVSVGVATRAPSETSGFDALSLLADAAMYREKTTSRL